MSMAGCGLEWLGQFRCAGVRLGLVWVRLGGLGRGRTGLGVLRYWRGKAWGSPRLVKSCAGLLHQCQWGKGKVWRG
jgi:hypothetical protein